MHSGFPTGQAVRESWVRVSIHQQQFTRMKKTHKALLVCTGLLVCRNRPLRPARDAEEPLPQSATIGAKSSPSPTLHARSQRPRRPYFHQRRLIGHDPQYPVWRAGACRTRLHTDPDLSIGDLAVPKGELYPLCRHLRPLTTGSDCQQAGWPMGVWRDDPAQDLVCYR